MDAAVAVVARPTFNGDEDEVVEVSPTTSEDEGEDEAHAHAHAQVVLQDEEEGGEESEGDEETSLRLSSDDEDDRPADDGHHPAVAVPPRPALPKRMMKKMEAPVAVPPRPALPKRRAATVNSSPELPSFASCHGRSNTGLPSPRHLQVLTDAETPRRRSYGPSSSPAPADGPVVAVPPRPRLPTRSGARSTSVLPSPRSDDEKNEAQHFATKKNESGAVSSQEDDLKRRQQEMARLAPFAPTLLYTDSFYDNRKKQEEESLEELRRLREEERRQAIEREREKAKKVVNVEDLNVRPHSVRGAGMLSKSDQSKQMKEGSATLRRDGKLIVRALDEFNGKLYTDPEKKKAVGKYKRKGLKFEKNDVIHVSAVHEEDGLYFGTLSRTGKSGWFPSFYVVIK